MLRLAETHEILVSHTHIALESKEKFVAQRDPTITLGLVCYVQENL